MSRGRRRTSRSAARRAPPSARRDAGSRRAAGSARRPCRSRRPAPPRIHVTAGVLANGRGEVLLCQRPPGGRFGLKWEFPGGKVEPGESPRSALTRELREELGIDCRPGARLMRIEHAYSGGPRVRLDFFRVGSHRGRPRNLCFHHMRWVPPARLPRFDILAADAPLVGRLAPAAVLRPRRTRSRRRRSSPGPRPA